MVRLQTHGLFEPAPGVPLWAMAWHTPGTVHVRRPFDKVFMALARKAHEIGHEEPDEGHHPWTHFCLRSPIALRFRWTHSRVTKTEARDL